MHALGYGGAVVNGTPEAPSKHQGQRPGTEKANWD